MGTDDDGDVAGSLRIGPAPLGMVRIMVETAAGGLPLDFEPEEAEELADELRAAAERARAIGRRRG